MCALHCCPFFASHRSSLCVCSMKHFCSCRIKFQWIFDAAIMAYSELKPLRSFLPTQNLIPWLFGHNYRTRTVGASVLAHWWNICLQCGRSGFDPYVDKSPWRRERLPTPVFWPGAFHGLYSPWGHKDLDMTKRLLLSQNWVHLFLIITLLDRNHLICSLLFHIHKPSQFMS